MKYTFSEKKRRELVSGKVLDAGEIKELGIDVPIMKGMEIACCGYFIHKGRHQEVIAAEHIYKYDDMTDEQKEARRQGLIDSCDKKVAEFKKSNK